MFQLWTGVLLVVANVSGLATLSYSVSQAWFPGSRARIRLSGAICVFFTLFAISFYGLALTGLFSPVPYACLSAGAWVAVYLRGLKSAMESAVDDVRNTCRRIVKHSGPVVYLFLAVFGAYLAFAALYSLVTPPESYDGLYYHLVRAAGWIQQHGLSSIMIDPNFEADYPYALPVRAVTVAPLGDAWSAWVMGPPRSDLLVPMAWFGVWGCLVFALYSFARSLGGGPATSLLAALTVGFLPNARAQIFSSHVDLLVALSAALGTLFLLEFEKHRRTNALVFGLLSFSFGIAVKQTALPAAGLGSLALLGIAVRSRRDIELKPVFATLGVCLLVVAPWPAYLGYVTGDPFPFPGFSFFEAKHLPANLREWAVPIGVHEPKSVWDLLKNYFIKTSDSTVFNHYNLGIAAPFLLVGSGAVTYKLFRDGNSKWTLPLVWLLVVILPAAAILRKMSIGGEAHSDTRYAFAGIALAIATLAAGKHKIFRRLLLLGLAVNVVYIFPLNIGGVEWEALRAFGLRLLPFVVLPVGFWVWGRWSERDLPHRLRRWIVAAIAASMLIPFILFLPSIRRAYRYDIYECLAKGKCHTPFNAGPLAGWGMIAQLGQLDDPDNPRRIAITNGFQVETKKITDPKTGRKRTVSTNIFFTTWQRLAYPAMGHRLQNELVSIPVTKSGRRLIPTEPNLAPPDVRALPGAWIRRLREHEVDYVISYGGITREVRWMAHRPETFELVSATQREPKLKNPIFKLKKGP